MEDQAPTALENLIAQFSAYMPTFIAGLFVLLLGVAVGLVARRLTISLLIWLRLDRLGSRVGWRSVLSKGDLRAALYNGAGDVALVLVVLVFLDNAFEIWGLSVLHEMLTGVVVYLPNIAVVAFILGAGLMLADVVAQRTRAGLREEGVPRARLLSRIAKAIVQAIVVALALWQLDFAREIVLAAFLIGFGALGVSFALAVGIGSSKAIQGGWEALLRPRDQEDEEPGDTK